jgi:nicotinamidase/pyrazinamidase
MAIKSAIIVIDVQRDFCEGGVLPARYTKNLISPLNIVIQWCIKHRITCVFTRDWHPADHCSFTNQGGPWSPHCVQGTAGAEFAEGLIVPNSALMIDIEKDSNRANMSYSAFESTNLETELRARRIGEIVACGIATDYCVKATVLDALRCGFFAKVLTDLIRPIDVHPGDSAVALVEMKSAGAALLSSNEWIKLDI